MSRRRLKKTNLFHKDINSLLYAYGDVAQPLNKTVQCLDELVSSYLVDICAEAAHVANSSNRNKIRLEDFKFALRKDPIKLARAEELISTNALITEANKQFNDNENQNLNRYKEDEDDDYYDDDDEDDDEDSKPKEAPVTVETQESTVPVKEKKKRTKKAKVKS